MSSCEEEVDFSAGSTFSSFYPSVHPHTHRILLFHPPQSCESNFLQLLKLFNFFQTFRLQTFTPTAHFTLPSTHPHTHNISPFHRHPIKVTHTNKIVIPLATLTKILQSYPPHAHTVILDSCHPNPRKFLHKHNNKWYPQRACMMTVISILARVPLKRCFIPNSAQTDTHTMPIPNPTYTASRCYMHLRCFLYPSLFCIPFLKWGRI